MTNLMKGQHNQIVRMAAINGSICNSNLLLFSQIKLVGLGKTLCLLAFCRGGTVASVNQVSMTACNMRADARQGMQQSIHKMCRCLPCWAAAPVRAKAAFSSGSKLCWSMVDTIDGVAPQVLSCTHGTAAGQHQGTFECNVVQAALLQMLAHVQDPERHAATSGGQDDRLPCGG
jgi:hypothetical protein